MHLQNTVVEPLEAMSSMQATEQLWKSVGLWIQAVAEIQNSTD
jgi:hypothetical protein